MADRELIVVRGDKHGNYDATFACAAHQDARKSYVAIEAVDGQIGERTIYRSSERAALERRMRDPAYRAVSVDMRTQSNLLPVTPPPERAVPLDLDAIRRAKSDEEAKVLDELRDTVFRGLYRSGDNYRGAFDGVAHTPAYAKREVPGKFVEYRGGARAPNGLKVEMAEVTPLSDAWRARMARVDAGFRAVSELVQPGATRAELDNAFLACLDPDDDHVYGSVLHHTGYDAYEHDIAWTEVQPYDYVTLGATIGDGTDTALVYRAATFVQKKSPVT